MKRSIIPYIIAILFFSEPFFSLFSPIAFGDKLLTLVPRFVVIFLVFMAVYGKQKEAIIYGIVTGLLYDIFYIDIIGVYTFLYPIIVLLAAKIMQLIHKHIVVVILLSLLLIAILEIASFGFASFISLTSISFNEFVNARLIPTILANSLFTIMFGWFFYKVLLPKVFLTKETV